MLLDNLTWKIKAIIATVVVAIIALLGSTIYLQNQKIKQINDQLEIAINNNCAYEAENSSLNGRIIAFQMTTDQLVMTRDSLTTKLNQLRKELGIKDKELKSLQLIISEDKKKDSVFVHDTIFKKDFVLDTLLADKWSALKLHATYPNEISAEYSFNNSTAIFTKTSKVILDKPKKCWIGRLFQKKYTVCEVEVVQENPYCTTKNEKFIEIIEKK